MPRKPKPKTHTRKWGAGTVTEVTPGTWRAQRARVRDADGRTHRPSQTFSGPDAAQRARTWASGAVEPPVLLLGHWLDRWLALAEPTLARNTRLVYRRHVAACAPLGARPLADLTSDDWQVLTNSLLARWGRYHVAVWRGNISTALRAAIPRHLAENPLARVRLPKIDQQPPKAWRQDEVDRLLTTAAGRLHEPWLVFALGTGVRLGEARGLLWADVDLTAKSAVIRQSADNQDGQIGPTKTRRVRTIDIPDEVIPVLAEHAKRQPPGERFVFGRKGHPIGSKAIRDWLKIQCRDAGITPLPPHACRHTWASLALDAGVPVQDVAKQLGHTVVTLLKTYSHYLGDDQRRGATAIGAALRHRFSGPQRAIGTEIGTREGS